MHVCSGYKKVQYCAYLDIVFNHLVGAPQIMHNVCVRHPAKSRVRFGANLARILGVYEIENVYAATWFV